MACSPKVDLEPLTHGFSVFSISWYYIVPRLCTIQGKFQKFVKEPRPILSGWLIHFFKF